MVCLLLISADLMECASVSTSRELIPVFLLILLFSFSEIFLFITILSISFLPGDENHSLRIKLYKKLFVTLTNQDWRTNSWIVC